MTIPERLGPDFDLLSPDRLPEGVRSLAGHVYIRMQRSPGRRDQAPSSAVELYVDLTSGELTEPERSHWQRVLGCTEGLHLVASEQRSQLRNMHAALEQLVRRLPPGASA